MIGEIKDDIPVGEVDDDIEDEVLDEDVVIEEIADVDNVGDISVEINVEELVAKLEATTLGSAQSQRRPRQHLQFQSRRRTVGIIESLSI